MVPIIIVSVFMAIAFVIFAVYLVIVIVKSTRKEKPGKPAVVALVLSGAVWAILGCVNIVLVIGVISHGDPMLDSLLNAGADAASKALVYTFENAEKNWNKDTLDKANLLDFHVVSVTKSETKDNVEYAVRLLLENRLPKGKPISYWDLTSQNLIFGLDANDVFCQATLAERMPEVIPPGKSYLPISIVLPKFAELRQIGIGERKLKVELTK